jgi:hypothetical protein
MFEKAFKNGFYKGRIYPKSICVSEPYFQTYALQQNLQRCTLHKSHNLDQCSLLTCGDSQSMDSIRKVTDFSLGGP